MSTDKEKIIFLNNGLPVVEIEAHPDEILDLDEEIVAIGKAKLAGIEFDEIFGNEDQVSPEIIVRQQRQKIRELFDSPEEVRVAFSSEKKASEAKKDIMIDGIDLEFIRDYCRKQQVPLSEDSSLLIAFGFGLSDSEDAIV